MNGQEIAIDQSKKPLTFEGCPNARSIALREAVALINAEGLSDFPGWIQS
jgi:hypothetical protein